LSTFGIVYKAQKFKRQSFWSPGSSQEIRLQFTFVFGNLICVQTDVHS